MTPHVDLIFLDSDYDPPYEISVALPELLTFERNNKDFFIGIDLGVQETVYISQNLQFNIIKFPIITKTPVLPFTRLSHKTNQDNSMLINKICITTSLHHSLSLKQCT